MLREQEFAARDRLLCTKPSPFMKTRPLLITLLIVLTAGCESTPTEVCAEENANSSACKGQTFYFRDELEPDAASGGGDRPGIPGCRVSYSDADCTKDRNVYAGDECIASGSNFGNVRMGRATELRLSEWTDGECHKARPTFRDRKGYDCNIWCKDQGFSAGQCIRTPPDVCGTKSSAYCQCRGIARP